VTTLTASAAVALAIVFALSAVLKLAAPAKAAEGMQSMPLPRGLVTPASVVALSIGEIALAAGLLFSFGGLLLASALAALVLSIGYLALMIVTLRRGTDASCACFGAASAQRVTRWSVVRNALLVGYAVLVLVGAVVALLMLAEVPVPGLQNWSGWFAYVPSSGSFYPSPGGLSAPSAWQLVLQAAFSLPFDLAAILVLIASFVALVFACERLGDSSARVADLTTLVQAAERAAPRPSASGAITGSETTHDPDIPGSGHELVGTMVPAVELVSRDGHSDTLRVLLEGRPTLLFFLSATCGPCQSVADGLPAWHERIGPSVQILIATSSSPKQVDERMPWLADLGRVRFGAASARASFADARTPSAVLLSGDGLIATPIAMGQTEIDGLLAGVENAVQGGQ